MCSYSPNVESDFYSTLGTRCLLSNTTLYLLTAGTGDAFFSISNLQDIITQIGGSLRHTTALSSVYKEHALADLHATLQLLLLNPAYRYISAKLRLSDGDSFFSSVLNRTRCGGVLRRRDAGRVGRHLLYRGNDGRRRGGGGDRHGPVHQGSLRVCAVCRIIS